MTGKADLLAEAKQLDAHIAELTAALRACAELGCIRMFWGASYSCIDADDDRDLCATCKARAVLDGTARKRYKVVFDGKELFAEAASMMVGITFEADSKEAAEALIRKEIPDLEDWHVELVPR